MADHHLYSRKGSLLGKRLLNTRHIFVNMLEETNKTESTFRSERKKEHESAIEFVEGDIFTADDALNRIGVGAFHSKLVTLSSLSWIAVGILIVFSNYISHLATCTFDMPSWYTSLLMMVITFCRMIGAVFYGVWCDKYGRRSVLSACSLFVFVFGTVSSGLSSYGWFLVFQSVASFHLGGIPQALTLCCEYLPGRYRGRATFIMCSVSIIGQVSLLGILYSLRTGDRSSWRFYTITSALPAAVVMFMTRWFPESIRYLLISDYHKQASCILQEIFQHNEKGLPRGRLYSKVDIENRGKLQHLFIPTYRRSTILFIFITFSVSLCRSMLFFLMEELHDDDALRNATNSSKNVLDESSCTLTHENNIFLQRVWLEGVSLPGYLFFLILVDMVNRKLLLSTSCVVTAFTVSLLFVKKFPMLEEASSFIARALLTAQMFMALFMAIEAYPTTLRGTANGINTFFLHLGVLARVFIFKAFLRLGKDYLIAFLCIILLLCALATACLTKETRNKKLEETTQFKK